MHRRLCRVVISSTSAVILFGLPAALTLGGGSFALASTSQAFTGSGYGPSEASALTQAEAHARMQGYG
jgi:pantoate kinase